MVKKSLQKFKKRRWSKKKNKFYSQKNNSFIWENDRILKFKQFFLVLKKLQLKVLKFLKLPKNY